MSESKSNIMELAKYPVLVFSIVIGLIVVKHALGLEFGVVTEVSTEGLKFSEKSNKATLKALTELETKLNDLVVRIESIEESGTLPDGQPPGVKSKAISDAFSASQAVSDATAKIAELSNEAPGSEEKELSGWMWIGNYSGGWDKPTISQLATGQPIAISPDSMRPGTEYKVLGNMVVRDGLPPNDTQYYRARKSLGVVPRGAVVTLLSAPEAVDREFAVQYWAEIEYQTNPNAN